MNWRRKKWAERIQMGRRYETNDKLTRVDTMKESSTRIKDALFETRFCCIQFQRESFEVRFKLLNFHIICARTTEYTSNVIWINTNPKDKAKNHLKLLATSLLYLKWTFTYWIIYIASDKRYNDKWSLIKSYRIH